MDLPPGFADPVFDAQRVFRAIMEALARPGSVQPLPDLPAGCGALTPGLAAAALTLADAQTPIWLDAPLASPAVTNYLRFHTGAPIVTDPAAATIALVADPARCPGLELFCQGTAEYPDASTTVILAVASFTRGERLVLEGPGIARQAVLAPSPVPPGFATRLQRNHGAFPTGIDHLLVTGDAVAGLPRSTRVTRQEPPEAKPCT